MSTSTKRPWFERAALPWGALAPVVLASALLSWAHGDMIAVAPLGAVGSFLLLAPATALLCVWLTSRFRGQSAAQLAERLVAAACARDPGSSIAPVVLLVRAAVIFLAVWAAAGFAAFAYRRADLAALVVAAAAVGAFIAALALGRILARMLGPAAGSASRSPRAWLPLASPLASGAWSAALLALVATAGGILLRKDLAAADLSTPVAVLGLHALMVAALAVLLLVARKPGAHTMRRSLVAAAVLAGSLVLVGAVRDPGYAALAAANRVPGVALGLDLWRRIAPRTGGEFGAARRGATGHWHQPPPRFVDPSRLCPGGDCNVVMILIDSWRADQLTFHGSKQAIMPRIEALAAEGVIFRDNYSPGPGTILTVPAMLAGVFDSQIEMTPRKKGPAPVSDDQLLVQESLQEAGVTTIAVLEHWYNEPLNQGFDVWDMTWNPRFHLVSTVRQQTDKVIGLLRAHAKERFFLYVHLMEPHHDYLLHEGFDGFGTDTWGRYRSDLAFTDHHVGRVLDVIRGEPTERPTMVIVSADHGEGLGQHGIKYHNAGFYRELTNVPLIVWHPALEHRVLDESVALYDIAPTLRNLYGLPPLDEHVGTSLLPQVLDGDELSGRVIYQQALYDQGGRYFNLVAVTRGNLRLMHDMRRKTWELFDISNDPHEERNLARAGNPRFEEMRSLLEEWLWAIDLDATFVHRPWESKPPGAR